MAPFTDHVAIKPDSQTSTDSFLRLHLPIHLNDLNRIHMATSHLPAPNGISHGSTSPRAQILLLLNKKTLKHCKMVLSYCGYTEYRGKPQDLHMLHSNRTNNRTQTGCDRGVGCLPANPINITPTNTGDTTYRRDKTGRQDWLVQNVVWRSHQRTDTRKLNQ